MTTHKIKVHQLEKILSRLKAKDELLPNSARNLAIHRDGKYIGFINLLDGQQTIELFPEPDPSRHV